ncbi:hypothetical protein B0I35DRAFT_478166 [Stachybotrys elegans]|uniref:NAD(P)-binding protein n=1 Tax=Stachybotrys elegans TaxID=80388 RepID=A0A8K0SSY0_9HYPO|nr:hypothetical protein B0I35DRAFT_478166 [Stachybotrys elegans]
MASASPTKSALVTGASKGGLGDYLARELHHRGVRVFAAVRTPSKAAHLEELGLEIIQLDVQDTESIREAAALVAHRTGGTLGILINNSGIGLQGSILDVDMTAARKVFDTNYFGVIEMTQAFAPLLTKSKGIIINIGSVVGKVPVPFEGVYNASKAALEQLSAQLRLELAPFDIDVTHVVTGGIKTEFFDHAAKHEFPPSSPYYSARETLSKWISGEMQRDFQQTDPKDFARSVASNALSAKPTRIQYVGYGSWWAWFFYHCLWHNAMDVLLHQMGVPNMKTILTEPKKSP